MSTQERTQKFLLTRRLFELALIQSGMSREAVLADLQTTRGTVNSIMAGSGKSNRVKHQLIGFCHRQLTALQIELAETDLIKAFDIWSADVIHG